MPRYRVKNEKEFVKENYRNENGNFYEDNECTSNCFEWSGMSSLCGLKFFHDFTEEKYYIKKYTPHCMYYIGEWMCIELDDDPVSDDVKKEEKEVIEINTKSVLKKTTPTMVIAHKIEEGTLTISELEELKEIITKLRKRKLLNN